MIARSVLQVFGTALLTLTVSVGSAQAQSAAVPFGGLKHDNTLPVEVSADSLSLDQEKGTASFIGNVVVGQGALRIGAEKIVVEYETESDAQSQQIARMTAEGSVILTNGMEAAEADKAVYVVAEGQVVMTGDVLLTQGANALAGEQLRIDLETGQATVEGRVRTVFQPNNQQ